MKDMAGLYLIYGILWLFMAIFGRHPRETQVLSILHPETYAPAKLYAPWHRLMLLAISLLNFATAFGQWWRPHNVGAFKLISISTILPLFALSGWSYYKRGTGWKNTLVAGSFVAMGAIFWAATFWAVVFLKR
jgi:hypothetical protein